MIYDDLSDTPKYSVVIVDPPWSYYGQQDKWGAAAKFYKTMSSDQIKQLPIGNLLNFNGVLFVWTTSAQLATTIDCIHEWGLYYRGVAFVWVKTKLNGQPIGAQGVRPSITKPLTEFVLAASKIERGRPLKLADEGITQTVFAPKREHSEKPEEVQDRIELMYPHATRIELFARRQRDGWDCWGDEVKPISKNNA